MPRSRSQECMEQLALGLALPQEPRTLVDDATGLIAYAPGIASPSEAAAWFETLEHGVDWQHERRPMYDRVVDVPRLTAWFLLTDPALPEPLRAARVAVERFARTRFNSVGLNFYRDGQDSVAMHSDRNEGLVAGSPVAVLSLGSTRRMHIQSKTVRGRRSFDVLLEPGSVILMGGEAQRFWEHGIPKTRDIPGPRISLAFRKRLAQLQQIQS